MSSQPTQGLDGSGKAGGGWANRVIHLIDDIKQVMIALGTLVFLGIGMQKVLWAELHMSDAQAAARPTAATEAGSAPQPAVSPLRDSADQTAPSMRLILIVCAPAANKTEQTCIQIQQWSLVSKLGPLSPAVMQFPQSGADTPGHEPSRPALQAAERSRRPLRDSDNGAGGKEKGDCK
jgi:hypothetical protein